MKLTVTSLIVIVVFLARGVASTTRHKYYRIPYGMAEFGPFRGKNLSLEMPLSKNLSQIDRLSLSEKCLPFRRRCSMAEQCCSHKCLVYIQRCNA
ncbi:uncharacterized protein LOC110191375 [Drosophila serrata]|uniref:uncharacterized protein LOC110191375 n=1 Tax=Drosophila serrata TaxID=7274 RepID=UPI000A1D012F|nr:uncharacterized protein LOC110191375 [Drosophila serrata]KAH8375138.1 hypothetical protein KR200_006869 [Drosophila serrata]